LIASTQDALIQRFTTMPHFATEPEWSAWIDARREDALEGRALFLAVDTPSGPVGSVNIIRLDEADRKAELGFWLAPTHRGQGIMTIALAQMSRWCFEEYGFARLELLVLPENEASLRLARRVGYTCEGLLRSYRVYQGRRLDLLCLSLLSEDQIP
jgi:RimJ/RimL family protein N-acetyltransferase